MNHAEFIDLHTSGVTAMRAYFDQAEKTASMLAQCTPAPLPFAERLTLASQEIAENTVLKASLAWLFSAYAACSGMKCSQVEWRPRKLSPGCSSS